ncbi:tripartite tricarboxylate transporter substrate binding protein BugD [Geodermatophilus sp. DF01-2]|uniref:tripartite tricarboxylate transporter substrate-binding protein n=1 Tax=Geodermatophilus sp. DF01-2 TaxID=2559610 RepID=UPI001073B6CA|nr:tripartite tricarboxylate transporter substrate-binding protein [Geodermatophilus sp. DF01_2]TFV59853.1 tripartite tricarboxylate transporter substrate binding protein BugD [Geodermatophilus sp. DF01_2]
MPQGHSYDAVAHPRLGRTRPWAGLAAATLTLAACGGGGGGDVEAAAAYPEGDITFVVPFSAGGPTDTVTRLIAEPMAEELGGTIVVQNVEGAGGTIAAGEVAAANPDGYTVLMHHIGMSTAPSLYPELPYDPLEDFKPVGLVTEVPMTLVARSDFEPETMEEFIEYVKENADTVTLANAGIGAASHLCGLLLQEALGVELTEVPYEGTGPALTDLVAGEVDIMCDQTTNTTGQIQAGEIKAYAVTTPERVESLPDLPTTEEAGLPELEVGVWHGLYVPTETPDEIVQELTGALQVALQDQNVIDQLAELGAAPSSEEEATPEAHLERLEQQIELWRPIIEQAGVSAD